MEKYICVKLRSEICAPVQLFAPGSLPTTDIQQKVLKKALKLMIETKDQGLNYTKLELPSSKLVLLSDAPFVNATGLKSQLGYIILMVDKNDNFNILN